MNIKIRPIVLCGGTGTRLWPESRSKLPKQFIPMSKGKTLFDVLPLLENLGFKVESIGEGLYIKDYRLENIVENKKIIIELSWIYWEIFCMVLI